MQYRFEIPVLPAEGHSPPLQRFSEGLAAPNGAGQAPPHVANRADTLPRRLRIVVAEDNHDAAETLRLLLEMYGHDVQLVYTGPAAVDAVRCHVPDALLCDIGLPGMNGFDVAKTLRADTRFSGLLMLAVTGYGNSTYGELAQAAGFNSYFSKADDPRLILDELQRFAERARCDGPTRAVRP
jgi:CheY-like chemotaxis protein